MDNQERKPLAPDRPGIYIRRDKQPVTILDVLGDHALSNTGSSYIRGRNVHFQELSQHRSDLMGRHESDAAYCLAQARLLCPEGYAVVPVEPTEAMLSCLDARNPPMGPPEKLTEEYAARWRDRHRRANGDTYRAMIASAAEGK